MQAVPKQVREKKFVPPANEAAAKAKGKGKEQVPEAMESNLLANMEMGIHRPELERTTTDLVLSCVLFTTQMCHVACQPVSELLVCKQLFGPRE